METRFRDFFFGDLEILPPDVPGTDDVEATGADRAVRNERKAPDLIPSETFELERVHAHLGSGIRTARVVLVDCPGDRLEVLAFGGHGASLPCDLDPGNAGSAR